MPKKMSSDSFKKEVFLVSSHDGEQVLCLPRKALPDQWIVESAIEPLSWAGFRDFLDGVACVWMPRSAAEHDPSFKQLIPYVVVKRSDGGTGCYRRHGNEGRLHGLWSVGIGGHINEGDRGGPNGTASEAIQNCLNREISEELGFGTKDVPYRFLGVINEELTDVGTVHLGLVFKVAVDDGSQVSPGDELGCFHWAEAEKIDRMELELWSRLAMQLTLNG
jgi:predicted NUDIX family phosphoesterase